MDVLCFINKNESMNSKQCHIYSWTPKMSHFVLKYVKFVLIFR